MASYHCSMKIGNQGVGFDHAQYICREGKYLNYKSEKDRDLEFQEHGNMPEWAKDHPLTFWEAADLYERINGRPYREIEIALPNELNPGQRQELVKGFIAEYIGENHPYSFAIHCPKAAMQRKIDQPHAHIMFSERKLDGIERSKEQFFKQAHPTRPELGGARKDRTWQKKSVLKDLRKSWALYQNRELEKYGFAVRVDHRKNEVQRREALEKGDFDKARELDRRPEEHLGPKLIQKNSAELQELLKNAKTPEEKARIRDEYYQREETNEKARLVHDIREYNRNHELLENEKKLVPEKSITAYNIHLKEINIRLNELLSERKAVLKKVFGPEQANSIAVSRFTKGESKRLNAEDKTLKKQDVQLKEALQKHLLETKPSLLDLSARQIYDSETKRLDQWTKDLDDRKNIHQKETAKLMILINTPKARVEISRIADGVLKKNEPYRDKLKLLNNEITYLQYEKGRVTQEKAILREHSRTLRNLGYSHEYNSPSYQDHTLINQVNKVAANLEQDKVNKKGLEVRIFQDDEDLDRDF